MRDNAASAKKWKVVNAHDERRSWDMTREISRDAQV